MTVDEDALRRTASKYVDEPEALDAFVESVRGRLSWRRRHGYKVCERCKTGKKPEEFGLHSRNSDGLRRECRECRSSKSEHLG